MVPRLPLLLTLLLVGCPPTSFDASPPVSRFYFPVGLVHVDSPVSPEGLLYVANANFDKRYGAGNVIAVNLSRVGLPAFGADGGASSAGPVQLPDLHTTSASAVEVASFAGEMAALDLGNGGVRLFVPSRSEGMQFHALDAPGLAAASAAPTLTCHTPEGKDDRDCATNAPSLATAEAEASLTGLPRAPAPFGVAVKPRRCTTATAAACGGDACVSGHCVRVDGARGNEWVGDVFVTHLQQADSPYLSQKNTRGYLVKLDSAATGVTDDDFVDIGVGASNSVAAGSRFVYVSGRYLLPSPNLVRLVDSNRTVLTTGLENSYRVAESRGLALSSDETRLFVAGRQPDVLMVVAVANATADYPALALQRAVSVPEGPNEVVVIARPGRGDLVVVTCSTAGVVVLYDDDVGDVVAQVPAVGLQPFGVAVDRRGAGARLYVSNFGDGRVAVIDIPDLYRPQLARLVAHLGEQQLCLTRGSTEADCGDGGTP